MLFRKQVLLMVSWVLQALICLNVWKRNQTIPEIVFCQDKIFLELHTETSISCVLQMHHNAFMYNRWLGSLASQSISAVLIMINNMWDKINGSIQAGVLVGWQISKKCSPVPVGFRSCSYCTSRSYIYVGGAEPNFSEWVELIGSQLGLAQL